MLWIVTAVFGLMSVLLFMGKGSFLIAGYNTASEKEKAKYNKLRLCRLMGGYMAFLTVFVGLCALYGNKLPDKVSRFFPYLFLFLTAAVFILANTVCRAKTIEKKEGESQEEKGNKRAVYGSWVFTGVILILVGFVLFTGNVKVKLTGSTMKIQGSYWKDYEVKLQDIKEISFREEFSVGTRSFGFGSFRLLEGNFSNGEFGNYILYGYTRCDSYVVMDTGEKMVAINGQTQQETEKLYQRICAAIER